MTSPHDNVSASRELRLAEIETDLLATELTDDEIEVTHLVPDQGEDESDTLGSPVAFSASIGSKDWTTETLVSQMRKGRIDLEPSFQRRNAWLSNRKSKLIESMMLGFPIPQIVLAERLDSPGRYFVLDGKQRLLALRQFFADKEEPRDTGFEELRLTGLEVLTELNRMKAPDLEQARPQLFAALENHSIRTVVLSQWNSERLLLSLFLRLNTGSVPLSPQELRQALIHGDFITWLDRKSGELPGLRRLLGNTHPDRRMIDAELCLRHLAFSATDIQYRGNLKQFLDDASRQFNQNWASTEPLAEGWMRNLDEAILAAYELFGSVGICRKWSAGRYERALNRAVFDFQIYSLSFPNIRSAVAGHGDDISTAFQKRCDFDVSFVRSITSTTKTVDAFVTRHRVWQAIIEESVGGTYPLPHPLARA